MTSFFCPGCWTEVPEEAARCGSCGADLAYLDAVTFEDKLMRALNHPEAMTARRAAEILGLRRSTRAVPALLERYRTHADPYLAAEIAVALSRIGNAEASAALAEVASHPSPVIREALRKARALADVNGARGSSPDPSSVGASGPPASDHETPSPEAALPTIELKSALARLEALASEAGAPDLAREANHALASLVRDEICVVVLGSFNRGKTSFVNALLGEPVLPVGILPLTSVATLVRYGPAPGAWLAFADGRRSPIDLADLPGYVAETHGPTDRSVVSHVEVEFPSDILAGGLVLADTPGIGSVHADATRRAREFLPRIDAAIFVLSPDPPVSQMELDYLHQVGAETQHLFFVVTKTDLFAESAWRESAAYSRRAIAQALGRPEDTLKIRPVVAPRSLELAPGTPAATAEDSGVAALSRDLRRLVDAEGPAVLRASAARRLRRTTESLLALLDLQEAALRAPVEELESALPTLEERISALRQRREEARALLGHGIERVTQALEGSLADLRAEALGGLASEIRAALDQGGRAGKRELVRRVDARIDAKVAGAYDDWRASVGPQIEDLFRDGTKRVAELVDGTLADLREWVAERFHVHLPSPEQPADLVESSGFYYLIEGARPQLTIQALGFLVLPRAVLRRRLRRRAERLAAEELDRNAGRLRADVAYRMQETARRFLARLEQRAAATEEGLHHAVELAVSRRHEGKVETNRELERIAAARTRLRRAAAHSVEER